MVRRGEQPGKTAVDWRDVGRGEEMGAALRDVGYR